MRLTTICVMALATLIGLWVSTFASFAAAQEPTLQPIEAANLDRLHEVWTKPIRLDRILRMSDGNFLVQNNRSDSGANIVDGMTFNTKRRIAEGRRIGPISVNHDGSMFAWGNLGARNNSLFKKAMARSSKCQPMATTLAVLHSAPVGSSLQLDASTGQQVPPTILA